MFSGKDNFFCFYFLAFYWVPLDNFYDSVMWDNLRTVIHLRNHSDNNQRIKNKQNINAEKRNSKILFRNL